MQDGEVEGLMCRVSSEMSRGTGYKGYGLFTVALVA